MTVEEYIRSLSPHEKLEAFQILHRELAAEEPEIVAPPRGTPTFSPNAPPIPIRPRPYLSKRHLTRFWRNIMRVKLRKEARKGTSAGATGGWGQVAANDFG